MNVQAISNYNNCYKTSFNKTNKQQNFTAKGLYAGSFDPLTNGHLDIIEKGSRLFDSLIVLVAQNPDKKNFIPAQKRLELINETLINIGLKNVTADAYEGYTVKYAKEHNAEFLLRGMRSSKDFDYEQKIERINKELAPDIETVTLFASEKFDNVSSTRVREYFANKSTEFLNIVPSPFGNYLMELLARGAK